MAGFMFRERLPLGPRLEDFVGRALKVEEVVVELALANPQGRGP